MVALQQANRSARVARNAAAFVVVNVRHSVANDLVTGSYMNVDSDLVGHGSGRAEQRRLVAK